MRNNSIFLIILKVKYTYIGRIYNGIENISVYAIGKYIQNGVKSIQSIPTISASFLFCHFKQILYESIRDKSKLKILNSNKKLHLLLL